MTGVSELIDRGAFAKLAQCRVAGTVSDAKNYSIFVVR
jgi:hypothetical protein